ncbi:DNA-directed RNA polymerase subunit beta [Actinobaculum suis]|uniref:DNA-directed RNA polymerase subunit beta n=1 Tax=Actinobaculum suis TaxID=1657 RepID=A0A0K9EVH1_9ACTO|nr:DNA-directed RNA polymerase subunit beta [Actinobaculum suis]KMY24154.1 DNA-directed RNA polymerase subunit beta [Actinobaculum suis]MDY5153482.1 DNA-directed RNA polymerase subunit beta [Actinobaculum suis]OCA93447.1 DNA-directed RNA polymerase subunit beta [Actinobaculum suis]OCA95267.1 DNA-directed RNA polymerase subunit beta [Actinobaculum suis]SDE19410.1 DNA-directed RNA polymerase subunit beta [Actinobaculum suis]
MAASRTYSLAAENGKPVVDRVSFAEIHELLQVPNLLGLQTDSFGWLIGSQGWAEENPGAKSGLEEIFEEISPIENAAQTMGLVLSNPHLEEPKYSILECRERDLTYSAPLYVTAEFQNYETGEIKSQTTFIGDFPLMTDRGTFIINGTERVVVSQLVRSPGVYFERTPDKTSDKDIYGAKFIPSRGAWLEFEIDKRDQVGVRIDRKRKQPITVFLKALGMEESEISEEFADYPVLLDTLEKDTVHTQEEALQDMYRKLRPGEPPTAEAGRALLNNFYFNPKRYDTAKVGRYKINQKLGLSDNTERQLTLEDIVAAIKYMLALHQGLDKMDENGQFPEVLVSEDGKPVRISTDDIDNFSNRRVRAVGELIQNQFRTGLSRLDRMVRERMTTQDAEAITPSSLINIRPIVAAIKEFFGTSQLSQFMDQNNPLAGLTHKRRLSALGPGGLSRDRAGMEVRDVHPSHYGRMCPIETPEGPNIGLIGSLASFARINAFGFIETPYRKVVNGRVTDEVEYLQAGDEDTVNIAQAETPLDEEGNFLQEEALVRLPGGEPALVPVEEIDYMDVSARQMVSIGSGMIPFLEHDDANRALMGANMQRQAVPLIKPVSPYVGTGWEMRVAVDSGDVTTGAAPGVVTEVDADAVHVEQDDGRHVIYKMQKFERSNPGNTVNQKVRVSEGDRIEVGSLIADGPATEGGELALGQNLLVAFMAWNGYNYEDAIILSERCVQDDLLTSIHIEEHEIDARDTKLGPEEVTRDIPNVSEDMLAHLDEHGIIRVGAEVRSGDILVGKITPKGETELTSEERLLRAIFGEKAKEVRDTSLRVPHGETGIVIGVRQFTAENNDELPNDVNETVRVYVAQRRKITVGDKMAGRHGNKGCISQILPVEDMPFMEDGTPVDIILNPLGVPSRMNLGQVYELHMGWIASQGWDATEARERGEEWALSLPEEVIKAKPEQRIATPVFDGATPAEVAGLLQNTLPNRDGDRLVDQYGKARLFDGRTGEPFPEPIAVGYMYMLKLHHLVDDKIHARSTGPYSMVTQQPLGGKAQFGGQRFGEMEVWALEAYGAAHTLQEMLTIKSDDTVGRVKVFEAIVKGDNVPEPGIPESFKVLMYEMRSLCLNVEALDASGQAISLEDEEDRYSAPVQDAEGQELATGLEDLSTGADF